MMTVLVPMLVSYLLDPSEYRGSPPPWKVLHDHALQRLMHIGPLYPAQFRGVMQSSQDMRGRLESAVKAQQATSSLASSKKSAAAAAAMAMQNSQKPTIQLKTDFSNFTG